MSSQLEGPDERHRYFLNGERVPGVTSTTGKAMDKPGLVWAAARETALWCAHHAGALHPETEESWVYEATRAHRTVWDESARRGQRLHVAAQKLVYGHAVPTVDPTTGEDWPEDEIRTAGQIARFMDQWRAAPVAVERPVFHVRDRWAGTLDLIADLKDGARWLLDYKTGKPNRNTGHGAYPKDAIQLAAYRHATHIQVATDAGDVQDRPMPAVDKTGIVWVQPDGYQLLPARSDDSLYRVFLSMLPVAAFVDETPAQSILPQVRPT